MNPDDRIFLEWIAEKQLTVKAFYFENQDFPHVDRMYRYSGREGKLIGSSEEFVIILFDRERWAYPLQLDKLLENYSEEEIKKMRKASKIWNINKKFGL